MALSGSFGNTFRTGYRLQIDWTATQSISANTSTVTAKMYLISLGSDYSINSSATKTGANIIDGTTYTFSGAGLADLNANQKKLLATDTKTITHNSDGTKTFSLDGYFDLEITLGGTYYGTVNLTATSFTLDTIPRKSTLSSSANWTAGNDLAVSISRASSSFSHTIVVKVDGVTIATKTGVTTSTTFDFTLDQNTTIFTELAQGASKGSTIEITTYTGSGSSGTNLGTNTYSGTCTAPTASTGSIPDFNIGDSPTVTISRVNLSATTQLTHTVAMTFGTYSPPSKTGVGTSVAFDTMVASSMYNQVTTAKSKTGTITVTTYFNGVQVRSATTDSFTATVTNSAPIFSASNISYDDSNTTTTAITGNNQYIIQNQSQLRAYVNTGATFQNGATFSKYVITCGSQTQDLTTLTGNKILGLINADTDQTLTIKVVDSRGFETAVTKTVLMLKHAEPVLTMSVARQNKFDPTTVLKVSGSFNPLTISAVNKNTILSVKYSYKEKGSGTYIAQNVAMTVSIGSGTFTTTDVTISLDSNKAYDFEVSVQDRFLTNTDPATVPAGVPIFFIDSVKGSVGVGMFPANAGSLEVKGGVYSKMQYPTLILEDSDVTYPNTYAITGYQGNLSIRNGANSSANEVGSFTPIGFKAPINKYATSGVYGINMNNSDIVGANGIFFNDDSQVDGEGLMFAKTGVTPLSSTLTDYYTLRVDGDGDMVLNGQVVASVKAGTTLWTGNSLLVGSTTITPDIALDQCPNGWLLEFANVTGTAYLHYVAIHKWQGKSSNSLTMTPVRVQHNSFDDLAYKNYIITNSTITGNDINSTDTTNALRELRKVIAW